MRTQQTDLHVAPLVGLSRIDALQTAQPGWLLFIGSARLPITQEGDCKSSGATEQSSIRTATWSSWPVPLASPTSHCQGSCELRECAQDREPGNLASSEAAGWKGPVMTRVTWSDKGSAYAFPLLTGNSLPTSPFIFGELLYFRSQVPSSLKLESFFLVFSSYFSFLVPNRRNLIVE